MVLISFEYLQKIHIFLKFGSIAQKLSLPCLCSIIVFWCVSKTFFIFEETKILTSFLAVNITWVYFVSCKSKNTEKIEIVGCETKYVQLDVFGRPCVVCKMSNNQSQLY